MILRGLHPPKTRRYDRAPQQLVAGGPPQRDSWQPRTLRVLVGALSVAWRGTQLSKDPEYQKRLAGGELKPPDALSAEALPALSGPRLFNARGSTLTFFAGILLVIAIGIFPSLRPVYERMESGAVDADQVSMDMAIMIVMLAGAGLITILFKASPEATLKGTMMRSGVAAIISIVGVAWLGSSFFEGNRETIVNGISGVITDYPWAFAAGLFVLSSLLFSGAATVVILMPIGLALGVPPSLLIAFYPAANSVFFLPTYGTLLAAVSFDQTGTTKIGKYLLNHSFLRPGLVTVATAIVIALLLVKVLPV